MAEEKKILKETEERFVEAVKEKVPVRLYLKNGKKLQGIIVDEDLYGIAFVQQTRWGAEETYIFKHSIIYIEPMQRVKLPKFKKRG